MKVRAAQAKFVDAYVHSYANWIGILASLVQDKILYGESQFSVNMKIMSKNSHFIMVRLQPIQQPLLQLLQNIAQNIHLMHAKPASKTSSTLSQTGPTQLSWKPPCNAS